MLLVSFGVDVQTFSNLINKSSNKSNIRSFLIAQLPNRKQINIFLLILS